jgi:hypothetical protein
MMWEDSRTDDSLPGYLWYWRGINKDLVLREDHDLFYDDITAHHQHPLWELNAWVTTHQPSLQPTMTLLQDN